MLLISFEFCHSASLNSFCCCCYWWGEEHWWNFLRFCDAFFFREGNAPTVAIMLLTRSLFCKKSLSKAKTCINKELLLYWDQIRRWTLKSKRVQKTKKGNQCWWPYEVSTDKPDFECLSCRKQKKWWWIIYFCAFSGTLDIDIASAETTPRNKQSQHFL